jgi:hypothetical protein
MDQLPVALPPARFPCRRRAEVLALKIAQPFMAGFTVRQRPQSRRDERNVRPSVDFFRPSRDLEDMAVHIEIGTVPVVGRASSRARLGGRLVSSLAPPVPMLFWFAIGLHFSPAINGSAIVTRNTISKRPCTHSSRKRPVSFPVFLSGAPSGSCSPDGAGPANVLDQSPICSTRLECYPPQ